VTSEPSFEAGGRRASLTLRVSPRARVLRLRVDRRTGAVVLTLPPRASKRRAIEWAEGHRAWIERQLGEVAAAERIMPGASVPLEGEPHIVDWAQDRPRTVRAEPGRIVVGGPEVNVEARVVRWLKRRALDRLSEETKEFAALAGVSVARVAVGDPVSRWGSCSATGGLRYSWRLVLAPAFVRRATVAHEVAHRVHMHHGPEFHALVETLVGADAKRARLWLRRHGAALHRIAPRG
jgi:predicted metal-dependent hydrolase